MFTVLDAHLQICTHKNAQVFLRLLFGIKKVETCYFNGTAELKKGSWK